MEPRTPIVDNHSKIPKEGQRPALGISVWGLEDRVQMTVCRDTACRVRQCKGRHRGCFGHGMPCPPMHRLISWMFRTRHAVSLLHRFTFHVSVFPFPFIIPPLCPSKLGGRAKRRGYVKKNRERMSGERGNIPPSGALLLVPLTQRDKVDGHVKPET